MSSVVVFGVTGYAGSRITAELLDRGVTVTGVARHPGSVEPRHGLTVVAGSMTDDSLLDQVTADASTIVVALKAVGDGDARLIDSLPDLLAAAQKANARLGFVGGASSLLVAEGGPRLFDTPEFPEEYKHEAGSHAAVLDALRASGTKVDWFYVSPAAEFGSYNPGERTGSYRTTDDVLLTGADGHSFISADDFAIAFADEIVSPTHHRARFGVAY